MTLAERATLALAAAGAVAAVVGSAATGRPRASLPMAVDLWTAAGLLRLTADGSWSAVALAAALVAVRQVVAGSLLAAPPAR